VPVPVLFLDCDGVLAETERDGHLVAFNRAFAEARLDVRWSEAEYGKRLKTGGGKERLAGDPRVPAELVAALHARKTAIFASLLGEIEARPGVVRLVDDALAASWRVAVVSTSAEESVRAVVERVLPRREVDVVAGDVVPAKKPDPAIYLLALERLGRPAVAVEDSRIGLLAAVRADLPCVVTPSFFTSGEDFAEAVLVVDADRLTLADLARLAR